MIRAALGLLAAAVLISGCGADPPDLFLVQRSGTIPGARLTLLVNDGGSVRCNGGTPRPLKAQQLLDAREIQRDLLEFAGRRYPPGVPAGVYDYRIRFEGGRIRFADSSRGLPPVLLSLQALTRDVARTICGLKR